MHHTYSAFGLKIGSDFECPELRRGNGAIDVHFRCGTVSPTLAGFDASDALSQVQPGKYLLNISGVARYLVSSGTEILVDPAPSADESAVRLFLLGSGIGVLLHQRNLLALHASAIATPRGAIVFAGISGCGKSTLAAAFSQRGLGTLADDICAIDVSGTPLVMPGGTCVKLWADALPELGLGERDLQPVRLGLKKYFLSSDQGLSAEPVPLHAVYVLQSSNRDHAAVSPIVGFAKFEALIGNTFRRTLLEPMGFSKSHFTQVCKIGASVGMRLIERPRDNFRMDELVDRLVEEFAA